MKKTIQLFSILILWYGLQEPRAIAQTEQGPNTNEDVPPSSNGEEKTIHIYLQSNNKKRSSSKTSHYFVFDLGLNNYLKDGEFPDENNAPYTVKPFGSWFVELNAINETHISGSLHLQWGAGVNWYNFKFENRAIRVTNEAGFVAFEEDERNIRPIKSKLTASYINLKLVPMLDFGKDKGVHSWCQREHSDGFRIGLGAYGGYRLGHLTKFVYEEQGNKRKDKSNDNLLLNNWRYGARLQFGYKDANFFVNYDLNELFSEGRGPQLNAFSFGVSL